MVAQWQGGGVILLETGLGLDLLSSLRDGKTDANGGGGVAKAGCMHQLRGTSVLIFKPTTWQTC